MADPFGSDDTDFDAGKLIENTYLNVVSYLREDYHSQMHMQSADEIQNPLKVGEVEAEKLMAHFQAVRAEQEEGGGGVAVVGSPEEHGEKFKTRGQRRRDYMAAPPGDRDDFDA